MTAVDDERRAGHVARSIRGEQQQRPFEILDIASEIVIWAFILVFGAICLALALAFGLGGREVAGRYLEKWLEQKKNE